jgi:hypothetical protein
MKNNQSDSEILIAQLCANTQEILGLYWKQAEALALGSGELKVAIVHTVTSSLKGGFDAESTISFGKLIKGSVRHTFYPCQTEMPFVDITPKPAKAKRLR